MAQEFDVVCLGGGVAGEAIAAGLRGSGLTLAVIERELVGATLVSPRAGESIGELVLAIRAHIPLQVLADVIHPYPAFNRVLGESLAELAAKAA